MMDGTIQATQELQQVDAAMPIKKNKNTETTTAAQAAVAHSL